MATKECRERHYEKEHGGFLILLIRVWVHNRKTGNPEGQPGSTRNEGKVSKALRNQGHQTEKSLVL